MNDEYDINSLFSSKGYSGYDFGELLNSIASKEALKEALKGASTASDDAEVYDWKKAYLDTRDEFDSYRKRTENARQSEKRNLTREIIRGFLEVVDYTLFTYKAKNKSGTYTKEDEMVLNKLSDFLGTYDVHPMKDPVGQTFDHNYHEAILLDESGMFESGTVSMVLSHGYMIGDEVLRHARVVVAK